MSKSKELTKRLREIETLKAEAEAEEKAKMDSVQNQIDEIFSENDMFCGIILTWEDIASIVRLALETKENVRIPYRLYFNE
jgi:hypothetical protein